MKYRKVRDMIIMERDCLCQYCERKDCEYCKHVSAMMKSLYEYGPKDMAVMFQVMRCPNFRPNEKYRREILKTEVIS